jgi:hypothetical protein
MDRPALVQQVDNLVSCTTNQCKVTSTKETSSPLKTGRIPSKLGYFKAFLIICLMFSGDHKGCFHCNRLRIPPYALVSTVISFNDVLLRIFARFFRLSYEHSIILIISCYRYKSQSPSSCSLHASVSFSQIKVFLVVRFPQTSSVSGCRSRIKNTVFWDVVPHSR